MIKPVGTPAVGRVDAPRVSASKPSAKAEGSATVRDGAGAAALRAATQIAGAGPPVDPEKVAALKAAIDAGRYTLDPDAIAARMIALDLPQPKSE